MKRFLALVLVLMLSCLCVTALNAEETTITPPATENTTPEANAPTSEENGAPAWGNTVTTTEFFDTVVMPVLLGLVSSVPLILGAVFFILKAWNKVKTAALKLKEALTAKSDVEKENEYLKELLSKIDVNNIVKDLDVFAEKARESFKIDDATIAEMNGHLATIGAKMENFMKAAENAWSASPAAVSLLTSAESTAIKSMAAKITSYENYIRAEKGAEAEDIIHDIEGV